MSVKPLRRLRGGNDLVSGCDAPDRVLTEVGIVIFLDMNFSLTNSKRNACNQAIVKRGCISSIFRDAERGRPGGRHGAISWFGWGVDGPVDCG
jgi:hypothetical protein